MRPRLMPSWRSNADDRFTSVTALICAAHTSMKYSCAERRGGLMGGNKLDLLQGTLDLMVLQSLASMGAMHGYGIARRIEQASRERVLLNQGTIYQSLVRLEQKGWIRSEWGTSENNRKAKFYSITRKGKTGLEEQSEQWRGIAALIGTLMEGEA